MKGVKVGSVVFSKYKRASGAVSIYLCEVQEDGTRKNIAGPFDTQHRAETERKRLAAQKAVAT